MAAVFYTAMIILNKFLRGIGSYERTIVQLAVATVVVLAYALATIDFGDLHYDTTSIVLAVIMGVVQTGIAFTLYFGTLRYMDAGNAAIFGYVEPVVSLFLSAVILGEILGPVGWIGAALILGSTLVYQISMKVVKLIRSKGVGIYFISQSPSDIPDKVLSQLSNRIQHGLRAYTPAEQKAVKAAAQAFRANPEFKTEDAILDLGVGEALISCLDEDGRPSIVQRAFIVPPRSYLGALSGK